MEGHRAVSLLQTQRYPAFKHILFPLDYSAQALKP